MSNTPQIRFAGFTDAWEQRKLGEVANNFEYGLNASAKEFDGKNKYIRITDIDDESRMFLSDDITSPDTDLTLSDKYKLETGDILFARTGASVGKTYLYREKDGLVYYAGFLIRAKINSENDAEFVFQNTLTDSYNSFIRITSQRSGQPGVNAQEYQDFTFFVPSLREQKGIGDFFRNLDNLITLHQRKCDALQKFKKSMLQKMFPKNGSLYPEIRFAGFTDAWEQREFGEVGSVSMCKRIFKDETVDDGEIPFYKIGTFGSEPDAYISRELYEEYRSKYSYPHKGDILLSASGTIGRIVEYNGEEAYFQDSNIVWLSHDETISNLFLKTLYPIVKWNGIEGSTIKRLYNDNFLKTKFMMPSLSEQTQIGTFFSTLDHLITLHQRKLETLKKLKKSMLQKMFV